MKNLLNSGLNVAYVHDWLVTYRGGEKVLEALLSIFPNAPVYTLFYKKSKMPDAINDRDIRFPKILNKFIKLRKALLPILPSVVESFPCETYDLIISSSSCVAKGIVPGPNTIHLCYMHSPMRYIWDQRWDYLKKSKILKLFPFIANHLSTRLRIWDTVSAPRVDLFIANSHFVASRICRYYGRDSKVIHPPHRGAL